MTFRQIGLHIVCPIKTVCRRRSDHRSAFGLYSTTITDVVIPNATLYESIGWGCLINAFYVVSEPVYQAWKYRSEYLPSLALLLALSSSITLVPR
jgi:hypothetical protein